MFDREKIVSRRSFLKLGSAAAVGAVTSGAKADVLSSLSSGASQALSPLAIQDLRSSLSGGLVTPADSAYGKLYLPNNLVYKNIKPIGIAVCKDEEDVSKSLAWCKKHDVSLIARNGGHSYAGYSTTSGLMINLQALNTITYDKSSETVRIGAGASNGQVYNALNGVNRVLTHGRCLGVGVGAFLLGGGVGFDMRRFGVGSDQMTQTELVLANGTRVRANATENQDLFWASRGVGGGNLGISTSFNVSVHPATEIVVFKINWSNVSDRFLANMFSVLEASPKELGHQIYLRPGDISGKSTSINAYMFGQYAGSLSDFTNIMAQINSVQVPSSSDIKQQPYWKGQEFISDAGASGYYRFRSRFINSKISDGIINSIRNNLAKWKNPAGNGYLKLYQTGGVINDIDPIATAFVHRSSQWMADVSIDWVESQTAEATKSAQNWQDSFYDEITTLASGGGAYQNFVDRSLKDWEHAYYGQNIDRLKLIKRTVDPGNLFNFQQSIKV